MSTLQAVSDSTEPLFCYSVCSPSENFTTVNVEWLHRRPAVVLVHDFFVKSQTDAILRTTRKKVGIHSKSDAVSRLLRESLCRVRKPLGCNCDFIHNS